MNNYNIEKVILIHHWTETLFSIICTRNKNFKFNCGEFTLIGIYINNKFITRAYSIVSSCYDDYLEFLSIKVTNGLLTSRLKYLEVGDKIWINKKTTGTLLVNNLLPGKNLWLISTGTGLAPFISIIKDFNTYEHYDFIILVHTNKTKIDLSYRYYILNNLFKSNYLTFFRSNLIYYPTLTRDNFKNYGKITTLINNKKIFNDLNLLEFNFKYDRVMLCGNNKMLIDIISILEKYNFKESKIKSLGHYVIERAFVD